VIELHCEECGELAAYCQCVAKCWQCGADYTANLDCPNCLTADCDLCEDCCHQRSRDERL